MKKTLTTILAAGAMLLAINSPVQAAPTTIVGTATYDGNEWNLIYEEAQSLVWLDFTNGPLPWDEQVAWAQGLGSEITVELNPGYQTNIDWSTGWRLPSAGDNPQMGLNHTGSEMGHLYYTSLGNLPSNDPGWSSLANTGPFEYLVPEWYWSNTEYDNWNAWSFNMGVGSLMPGDKDPEWWVPDYGMAVIAGTVVPEPAGMAALIGMAMVGFVALWRRRK